MKKSKLDEMQELKLLKIESRGFGLALCALLAAVLIQGILGGTFKEILGEVIVLLLACVYMVISCIRNGIWDRHLKANQKTNFFASLIAGLLVGIFSALRFWRMTGDIPLVVKMTALLSVGTFALAFLALSLCSKLYTKRHENLEQE